MKINYLSVKDSVPATGYWDHAFIKDLLEDLPEGDREVFVIPGAYQGDDIPAINTILSEHKKVMVFITSDEEGKFDCSKLDHPDMIHYCQYGNCEHPFPLGYTSKTRKYLKDIGPVDKDIEVFFAGQLNSHERRTLFASLAFNPNSVLFGTNGFASGLPIDRYYIYMARAKFAPSPPGHVSPDSFRFYESLEAGCHPLYISDYFNKLFPDMSQTNIFAWWIGEKVRIRNKLRLELGCSLESTTAIIMTSPISSHPSTKMIEQTIKSIRHHLDSDIIIGIDGVRPEQADMKPKYEEYIRNLVWKCNFEYKNVIPIIFDEHKHQSGMIKAIMPLVKTPLILFAEHDTPLVVKKPIDFPYLQKTLLEGNAFYIRFQYFAYIPVSHKHLMIGKPENFLQKTAQWSQRPHLARSDFYREIIKFFSEESNCFIEDLIYGKAVGDWVDNGIRGWNRWRLYIYMPEKNIKRSLNLDGRKKDYKFEKEQIW